VNLIEPTDDGQSRRITGKIDGKTEVKPRAMSEKNNRHHGDTSQVAD
jgi:hypothetical protein